MTVNWAFWGGLDLWPLDAACKIACGVDPESPTYWSQIVCDEGDRPGWADMMIEAGLAIENKKLPAIDRAWSIRPEDFRAWITEHAKTTNTHRFVTNVSRPKV